MSEKNPTVLLSALDGYGGAPFDEIFDIVWPVYGAKDVKDAASLSDRCAVVIWGGADISPTIYGQQPNQRCDATAELSDRDKLEVEIARKAIELGIPIVGVCRGAQLMCALSGATLVQHVDNHAGPWHEIKTIDDKAYNCPSLHHQMMYPWARDGATQIPFELIAWSKPARSKKYWGEPLEPGDEGTDEELKLGVRLLSPEKEPEIVWFPDTKSLGIQSHPEFIHKTDHPFVKYCLSLTKEKFGL